MAEEEPNYEDEDRELTAHHVTLLPAHMLSPSPSAKDGVPEDEEARQRIWGCELIQEAGILLRQPQPVMCTAQNLFHRFYYRKSLKSYDAFLVAMGCFFLASKVEEKPKRIRECLFVFHYAYRVRCKKPQASLELGGAVYNGWKDSLVRMERTILKELGFSFYIIEHAHRFILFFVKLLEQDGELAQEAWAYLNDSMRLDCCLRHKSEVIACAAIHLAARKSGVPLPETEGREWWTVFDVAKKDLDDVVQRILGLYIQPKVTWLESLAPGPRLTDDAFEEFAKVRSA
eukprot:CAMPEP_0119276712 /NCGR_PEP_ID=MMETSP1329-20130426/15816_1 /TAXON_ID=114041 /ORGANISM="Genus nov. species nov., Strain RCC1024" /LENGTH=286 /DNA_ID=CAMNT_0007277149 /DNA_START=127 /DNA_END=984 /DNA_ORIENTATION=+